MNIWHWSDPHLGHNNCIIYSHRPVLKPNDLTPSGKWVSEFIAEQRGKEMDSIIINNFNAKVKPDDLCICYGDFCFGKSSEAPNAPKKSFKYYRNELNCKNIIFIRGSHDKNNGVKTPIRSIVISIGGHLIKCVHDPKEAEKEYFFNFTGHLHGKNGKFTRITNKSFIVDLSVENWNYYPITYTEIDAEYHKWRKRGFKNE